MADATDKRIRARDGRGRVIVSVEQVEQDRRCAELRSESKSLRQIAAEMGIHWTTVGRAIERGLASIATSEDATTAKTLELLKCDSRERRLNEALRGRITPAEAATVSNALDRVQRRRAALLGLDAPTRIRIEEVPEETVDSEILRLEAELAKNGPMPAENG